MRQRIRGHYRIDEHGRVVPADDTPDPVLPYEVPLPPLPPVDRWRRLGPWKLPTLLDLLVVALLLIILATLMVMAIAKLRENARLRRQLQAAPLTSTNFGVQSGATAAPAPAR